MKKTVLCYVVDRSNFRMLMGFKKRGFGAGTWGGFGGKQQEDETPEEAANRELFEETELTVEEKDLKKMGEIIVRFPFSPEEENKEIFVNAFVTEKWIGVPKESEEMIPKWFPLNAIPFSKMWECDRHWTPLVLEGRKVRADFYFAEDNKSIASKKIDLKEKL